MNIKMNKYDTLILSGNATNAIVTLGALQYLYDNKYIDRINTYIGTSSGAILSLLLLIGYEPIEILAYLCVEKVYKTVGQINISNMLLMGKPLMDFEPIENCIEQLIIDKLGYIPTMQSIENWSNKKLIFTTYNLTDECREYISSDTYPNLPVINAIRMSSNYPLVFEPYVYENKSYLDGGIVDNFAIEYGESLGGKCLGIMTNNPHRKYNNEFSNIELIWKIFQIFKTTVTNDKIDRTKVDTIKLNYKCNFFNFDTTNKELIEMFDIGHELCKYSNLWKNTDQMCM